MIWLTNTMMMRQRAKTPDTERGYTLFLTSASAFSTWGDVPFPARATACGRHEGDPAAGWVLSDVEGLLLSVFMACLFTERSHLCWNDPSPKTSACGFAERLG